MTVSSALELALFMDAKLDVANVPGEMKTANKPAPTTAPISALFICFLEPSVAGNATSAPALNSYIALSREARPNDKEETNGYDGERSS
jgi:hypothetical protein